MPKRSKDAHKGDFGRVLVIGGSRGMLGAPALAAEAALRTGAGLVTIACPASIQLTVAGLCPCATTLPLPETPDGLLDPEQTLELLKTKGLLDDKASTVVAAGPGLGVGPTDFCRAWLELLHAFADVAGVPVVLDADGLNALAVTIKRSKADGPTLPNMVLTPHAGEMARLCETTPLRIQQDREAFALEFATRVSEKDADERADGRAVLVLKGAGTIVTDGKRLYVNKTGNPGMATGGSGDVLTGVIASLIGQRMSRFDAAVLGVRLHGEAGDLAADVLGEASIIAADLIQFIPDAMGGFSQLR